MPPRRRRDYQREYKSRTKRQGRQIPKLVARGHGPIPAPIARRLERGEPLTEDERRFYAAGLAGYEALTGTATGKSSYRPDSYLPERFDSPEQARIWLDGKNIAHLEGPYMRIVKKGGVYRIRKLRG